MSTILQAQQKHKQEQAGGPPAMVPQSKAFQPWKVLLGLALFIIIALLSTLIYLLLNPSTPPIPAPIIIEQVQQPQESSSLVKVSFDTQPLSIIEAADKPAPPTIKKVAKIAPSKPLEQKQSITESTDDKTTPTQTTKVQNTPTVETENNFEESSEELKKRFELAVLLSEIDDNELQFTDINDADNDGSDIRQMNGSFQNKVPAIRYDSHMYSTIADDRWIRINGETLKEGDTDSSGELELIEIQPQRSIFRLDRQSFSLESLVDWKGY